MLRSKSSQSLPSEVWSEVYGYLPRGETRATSVVSQSTAKGLKEYAKMHQWTLDHSDDYYHDVKLSNVVLKLLDDIRTEKEVSSSDQQNMQLATAIYATEKVIALGGTFVIITDYMIESMQNTFSRIGSRVPIVFKEDKVESWQPTEDPAIVVLKWQYATRFLQTDENIHTIVKLGATEGWLDPPETMMYVRIKNSAVLESEAIIEDETSPLYYRYYEYGVDSKLMTTIKQSLSELQGRVLIITSEKLALSYPIATLPSQLETNDKIMIWHYDRDYTDEYEHIKLFDSYVFVHVGQPTITRFASLCWRSNSVKQMIVIRKQAMASAIPVPTHVIREALESRSYDNLRLKASYSMNTARKVASACGLSYAELAVVAPLAATDMRYPPKSWASKVLGRGLLITGDDRFQMTRHDKPPMNCWLKLDPRQNTVDTPEYFDTFLQRPTQRVTQMTSVEQTVTQPTVRRRLSTERPTATISTTQTTVAPRRVSPVEDDKATREIKQKLLTTLRDHKGGDNSYTIPQLKVLLKARGLKITGSRAELANRLLADL